MNIEDIPPLVDEEERRDAARLLGQLNDLVWTMVTGPGHNREINNLRHDMIESFAKHLTGYELGRYT